MLKTMPFHLHPPLPKEANMTLSQTSQPYERSRWIAESLTLVWREVPISKSVKTLLILFPVS